MDKNIILKHSKLLSSNRIIYSSDKSKYTAAINTSDPMKDLLEFCISKSNILNTTKVIISTQHKRQSYINLEAHFESIIKNNNINHIVVFGTSEMCDLLQSYFSFFKKYNDISIEEYRNDDNYIIFYDSMPIKCDIESLTQYTSPNFQNPYTQLSAQNSMNSAYAINIGYVNLIHNALKFILIDDPIKVTRKLKIEKLDNV